MRKLLFSGLCFVSILAFKHAYCQDNLLAVDVLSPKQESEAKPDKVIQKENMDKTAKALEEPEAVDNSDGDFKKIKAYNELLDQKQKELELIKLELEKSSLLLKRKEAEKEIYEIDKNLPQAKLGTSAGTSLTQEVKEPLLEPQDVKLQLLLISDDLKEGMITLKGLPYSFKEKDYIASKLFVEQIDVLGITFKQHDGSVLRINFIN